LYLCIGNTESSISLASTRVDTTLWHHRLGHISEKGMQILHKRNLLPDLKQIDLDFYEHCVYGKQKRVRFLRVGKEKKNERLELVHTDVWGPTQVSSLGGSHYYVTFIDDATRKTWVYCIRQKSDVFDTFKKWKALVENETGKSLKCLRLDNGGEYCNKEFDYYCSYHGIHREKTVPRTPQENGVSERMNRTIMERARSMRLHASLPLQFWADAVDTVVYLINRGPSSSLDGIIPEEEWTGKKVNYYFLKTFGCEAFSILIKKIEQSLRQNPRNVPLLDMVLMILVIAYGIMKITKSLGVEMSYSMRRSCTKISCRERNRKQKNKNTQCLMRSLKRKFQRNLKIKMYNSRSSRYLKHLQVLLEDLPG
jgi:transposase InsO family protein